MRAGLLIGGAAAIVIGLVFALVPFVPQVSTSLPSNTPRTTVFHGYAWNLTGFSLTGRIAVALSWTANLPVNTTIEVCPSGAFNGTYVCRGTSSWPGNSSGTSGGDTFNVAVGSTVLIAMYGSNQSQGYITGHVTNGTVALVILILGIVLLLSGVVLRRRKKVPPPTPSAQSIPAPPGPPSA